MAIAKRLVSSATLASASSTITLDNIPQDYTDLVLVTSLRDDVAAGGWENAFIYPNNSSANMYSRFNYGWGTTTGTGVNVPAVIYHQTARGNNTANTFSNSQTYISGYSGSGYKYFSTETGVMQTTTSSINAITASTWSDSTPITSIVIQAASGNFVAGSSAYLYAFTKYVQPGPTGIQSDQLLEEVVLSSSAASVTFSGLDAYAALGYTNLQIRAVTRNTGISNGNAVQYTMNGDSGANYSYHWLLGNGSAVQSGAGSSSNYIFEYSTIAADEPTGAFSGIIVDILDPFNTSKYTTTRTFVGRSSSRTHVSLSSGSWRNTAALTSYTMQPSNGNWVTGSRFSLYGSK